VRGDAPPRSQQAWVRCARTHADSLSEILDRDGFDVVGWLEAEDSPVEVELCFEGAFDVLRAAGPQGNTHPWHAPHNVYPCVGDDQWITIDVATDQEFVALCCVLDRPRLADPRLNSRGFFPQVTMPGVGTHRYPSELLAAR
jgi:hypothetical protein